MKKLLCMIMALTMVLGLAACGGSGEPADNGEAVDYKIGIITGTTAQGEEEFRAAENLKKKYGDMVVTATYPDNASSETDVTMQRLQELAADPDVKAIFCAGGRRRQGCHRQGEGDPGRYPVRLRRSR